MKQYQTALIQLESDLEEIAVTSSSFHQKALTIIQKSTDCLLKLRHKVLADGFNNDIEEIAFFKKIKPKILSYILYYRSILKIESRRPFVLDKDERCYLENELIDIKRFFDENREFFEYFKNGETYLDKIYFTSGAPTEYRPYQSPILIDDPDFLSLHGITVAMITSYNRLISYLQDELRVLEAGTEQWSDSNLEWTENKIDLIELIYALHNSNALNNGKSEIKDIKLLFEEAFNINLGNIYRAFIEIQSRRGKQVKFIDNLKQSLIEKVDEADS